MTDDQRADLVDLLSVQELGAVTPQRVQRWQNAVRALVQPEPSVPVNTTTTSMDGFAQPVAVRKK